MTSRWSTADLGARLAEALRNSPPELTPELAPLIAAGGVAGLSDLDVRRRQVLEAAVHERHAAEISSRLEARGIVALFAKGWAAALLYPRRGDRPCGDIDVYVAQEEYAAAREALRDFRPRECMVDLHRGCRELDDRPWGSLVARAEHVHGVRVLGREEHLRLLCLHGLKHGLARPIWLVDIARALDHDLDRARLLEGDHVRTAWVRAALELAHLILGARRIVETETPLPSWLVPSVLRAWSSPFTRRRAMAEVLRRREGTLRELLLRWPNPIEASIALGVAPGKWPRATLQLAESIRRAARFSFRLRSLRIARHPMIASKGRTS